MSERLCFEKDEDDYNVIIDGNHVFTMEKENGVYVVDLMCISFPDTLYTEDFEKIANKLKELNNDLVYKEDTKKYSLQDLDYPFLTTEYIRRGKK